MLGQSLSQPQVASFAQRELPAALADDLPLCRLAPRAGRTHDFHEAGFGGGGPAGRQTVNVVPAPAVLATAMVPR